jgi:biotin carboxylase
VKKIIILGGSHRDIPLIKAAQDLGYFVITLGDREYYLGHNYSNKAYKIDFSDLNAVRDVIEKENADYILPGSGEISYLNCVKLSHELNKGNFDTLEVANIIHNKWKFKDFCLANNISTPKGIYYNIQTDIEKLSYPLVVKPTDLSGGRGVNIVKNSKELQRSLTQAQNLSDEIFLEEYIEGELIAYSVFLQNQHIAYAFSGADKSHLNPFLVTTAYPITLSKDITLKLNRDIEKIAKELSLVDGMFHLQILIQNNTPYIIDVTRRIPGDLYPYLIEYTHKVEYSKAVVQAYLGKALAKELNIKEENFIVRHVVMPDQNGIYNGLKIDKSIEKNIIYRLELMQSKTEITDYLHTQLAIIFIKLKSMDDYTNPNKLIKANIARRDDV